ncbi:MAG: hypothetical protein KGQ59_01015, partial [Bdellovibrionales bacterium]|nr:hypothetical protein [Bdellovibrionales bacterium]
MRLKGLGVLVASLSVIGVVATWHFKSKSASKAPLTAASLIKEHVEVGTDELKEVAAKPPVQKASKSEPFDVIVGSLEGKQCSSVEFAGGGPASLEVDPGLWAQFISDYRKLKIELV